MAGRRAPVLLSHPLYIAWEITLQCNARCVHCYSSSGPSVRHPGELTTAEAHDVIDGLADAGLIILGFSGGEPLRRRDVFALIRHATDRGLVVHIASNGSSITPRRADRLRDAGVRSVTVSLDAVSAELHDRIRRCPGLFEEACRAVRCLAHAGVRAVVSFTPMRLNFRDGPAVVALAHELGAAAANMSEYVPAGRGTPDLALSPTELRDVVLEWIALRRRYAGRLEVQWHDCRVAMLVPPEERGRYSGCGAGHLTARITVDGTVTPCVFLDHPAGNLRTDRFATIWAASPLLRAIRDRASLQIENCGRCELRHVCGGCRAAASARSGDLFGGDPSCWILPLEGV